MKAVVFDRFGAPEEVLGVRDVALPQPGPGQVRVRVLASPVNPSDLMMVRGAYSIRPTLPATPGLEGVGVVEAAGPGALGRLLMGRRVCVIGSETGAWAEHALVAARQASPVPGRVSDEQAAMSFVNPVTAYAMTQEVLGVKRGEWLLQTAAASELGRMVVRLGRRLGFRTLNVVRKAEQADELRALGGDVCLVASAEDLEPQVRSVAAGVRCAIDPVGGALGSAVVRCLAPGGRLLVYGTLSGEPISFSPRDLMTPGTAVEGFWLGNWMRQQALLKRLRVIRSVWRLVGEGVLASRVGARFPLGQVREAVGAAAAGRDGKVLICPGS